MFDRIDTIRFKNYKSFTGSAFEELDFSKPVNVFIGKNNTGKSSIVDMNSTPFVRQYGILLINGVLIYGKRNTEQKIHGEFQTRSRRNYA